MKHIKFYSRYLAGRDFVVGDIHGCYDQVMDLSKEIKSDFSLLVAIIVQKSRRNNKISCNPPSKK